VCGIVYVIVSSKLDLRNSREREREIERERERERERKKIRRIAV